MKKIRNNLVHTLVLATTYAMCASLCSGCGKQSDQQTSKEDNTSTVAQEKEIITSYYKESDFEEIFSEKGKDIIDHFDKNVSYKEALEDVSEINLAYDAEFDKSEYTEKVVKDKENATTTYQYYDGDTLMNEKNCHESS